MAQTPTLMTQSENSNVSPLEDSMSIQSAEEIYRRNMQTLETQRQSVIRNNEITDGYISRKKFFALQKKYNSGSSRIAIEEVASRPADVYGEKEYSVIAIIKKSARQEAFNAAKAEADRLAKANPAQAKAMEVEANAPIPKSEIDEITATDSDQVEIPISGESANKPKDYVGTQSNLLDELFLSQGSIKNKASKRAIKTFVKIAEKLQKRFGIKFEIVTAEEAYEILKDDPRHTLENLKYGYRALYHQETQTALLIKGNFNAAATVHEIFSHPFLNILKNTPSLRHIYNQLALEASKQIEQASLTYNVYSDYSEEIQT